MARGRKPIGARTMSAAERQQRRRDKINAALPPHGSEDRFRLELYRWVHSQLPFYAQLDAAHIGQALEELGCAIRLDTYCTVTNKGDDATWRAEYLARDGLCQRGPPKLVGAIGVLR